MYAICFVKKSRIIICARVGGIIEKKMITIFFFYQFFCRKNATINHNNFYRAERVMRKILVARFFGGLLSENFFFPNNQKNWLLGSNYSKVWSQVSIN